MRRTALFALPIVLALALAGCGDDNSSNSAGSSSSGSKTTTTEAASGSSGTSAAVVKMSTSSFGQILTDTDGNTLYVFDKDTGTTSNCNAGCQEAWPPMKATGTPTGDGIDAEDLGTTTRADGSTQLTFYGRPVYHYAADTAPGQTTGEGVGGIWWVVDKDGNEVKSASGAATTMAPSTTKAAASSSGY